MTSLEAQGELIPSALVRSPDPPAALYRATNLWNASASAWNIDEVTVGAAPELRGLGSSFVGKLPEAMEDMARKYFNGLNSSTTASHIAGIGKNPEAGVENPWCFFIDETSQFVCYVQSSFQQVSPFFYPEDHSYADETGTRCWKLVAFGLLCIALLFLIRFIHEELILAWLFGEESERSRQERIDEAEFDDAVEDVINDAAGNASGWLFASLIYWLVVGFAVQVQPYAINVQYGTTQPVLLGIAMMVVSYAVLHVSTYIEIIVCDEGTPIRTWFDKHLSKYCHGFGQTVQGFSVGYLIYMLWLQVQFQAGKSPAALDQLRCSNGFTAFTPNYPEAESLSAIYSAQPLSPFGMALLMTLLCVYSLAFDTQDMASRCDQKRLMMDLHGLVKRLRQMKHTCAKLEEMDEGLDEDIEEAEQAIAKIRPAKGWFDLENKQKVNVKKNRLSALQGNEKAVEFMISHLQGAQEDLKSHQDLIKKRVLANHYAENYLDNKKDAFAVVIGLAMEGVFEASTAYIASCEFMHPGNECGIKQCNAESNLHKASRTTIVDFIAAMAALLFVLGLKKILIAYEFIDPNEVEEDDLSDGSDTDGEEDHHQPTGLADMDNGSTPSGSPVVQPGATKSQSEGTGLDAPLLP